MWRPNVNACHLFLNNNDVTAWRHKWNYNKWCRPTIVTLQKQFWNWLNAPRISRPYLVSSYDRQLLRLDVWTQWGDGWHIGHCGYNWISQKLIFQEQISAWNKWKTSRWCTDNVRPIRFHMPDSAPLGQILWTITGADSTLLPYCLSRIA